ncbi:acylneuraminate cytidylyltransferase [Sporosarcina sp. ANT_H38]|nr:acylneuraminate cytidylyltransferase [Sporosarcina sp. ANT_H38]
MGSTRLPGKVLKTVMDKTLLEYQIERVSRSTLIDKIIVATTDKKNDNVIANLCEQFGVNVYRGSEEDVLSRYYEAATEYSADVVVRLTSDCPLIDPEVTDQVIQLYLNQLAEFDYVSNTLEQTFPRGLDVEVFSISALQKAYENASLEREREHVTSYLYMNPEKFQLGNLKCSPNLGNHRWTVDTEEDFELIQRILQVLYPINPKFTTQDVIGVLAENPSWIELNAHIEQKKL